MEYTPEISAEIKRRINVAVYAYAYEIEDAPLVSDAEFDALALSVQPSTSTGRPELDKFFRTEFSPHTGQWVHRHPHKSRLREIAGMKRQHLETLQRRRIDTVTAMTQVTDQSPNSAIDNAVKAYRDLRDERAALKKEFDAIDRDLKEKMTTLEVALLKKMDGLGISQLRTPAGMAYVETSQTPSCGDWDAFYAWVLESGRLDCLQKRLASTTVKDIVTETGELPPGCTMVSERVVSIRK